MLFARETVCAEFLEEMRPLLERHYHEIAHYQDIKLEPNFAKYIDMDRAGNLRVFTARDEERKLIGYGVFFVTHNMHYQGSLQASQDIIFIEKSTRGRGMGRDFINWCDFQLRNEGVQVVYHHVKQKHNFGPMLETLGYQLVDLIYGRRLDKSEGE